MIREATINDAARITEIEVASSQYAYKNIVSDKCLFQDLSVENRAPVHKKWINEKRFGVYVYEDSDTGIRRERRIAEQEAAVMEVMTEEADGNE